MSKSKSKSRTTKVARVAKPSPATPEEISSMLTDLVDTYGDIMRWPEAWPESWSLVLDSVTESTFFGSDTYGLKLTLMKAAGVGNVENHVLFSVAGFKTPARAAQRFLMTLQDAAISIEKGIVEPEAEQALNNIWTKVQHKKSDFFSLMRTLSDLHSKIRLTMTMLRIKEPASANRLASRATRELFFKYPEGTN